MNEAYREPFWNVFETMNEVVYVTDMENDEVIYINRYGREILQIDSMEEVMGQPCYKVVQQCPSRCSICTNDRLKPGEFYEWKYYNAIIGKTFKLKDTMIIEGGKRYRLEIAIDISETDVQKRTIKEFTSNEALVNDALRLSLMESTPEKSLNVLLNHLGQSLRSDRVYIFEETDHNTLKNTYEWCSIDIEPQKDYLQDVSLDVVALWYEKFNLGQNVIVKSLDNIRLSDPRVYELLQPQQVDSLVVSPLMIDGKIIGFYGVDNPPANFLNHISVMFMVLGHFIASMLKRRNLVDRLEKLSYYDPLTGALNRHGMNEFVANVDHGASIGIVYCDVLGLKRVNDEKGHLAGDALITNAYACLSDAFEKESVFRIGGDEFIVLAGGITEADLAERIRKMREHMPLYHVNFSVGTVWEPKCNGRIMELMKLADEKMYENKAAYYAQHPIDGRGSVKR